jgi:hypothetical protein
MLESNVMVMIIGEMMIVLIMDILEEQEVVYLLAMHVNVSLMIVNVQVAMQEQIGVLLFIIGMLDFAVQMVVII